MLDINIPALVSLNILKQDEGNFHVIRTYVMRKLNNMIPTFDSLALLIQRLNRAISRYKVCLSVLLGRRPYLFKHKDSI